MGTVSFTGATTKDRFGNTHAQLPAMSATSLVDSPVSLAADGTVRANGGFGRARVLVEGAGSTDSAFVSVAPAGTIVGYESARISPLIGRINGVGARVLGRFVLEVHADATYPSWAPDGSNFVVRAIWPTSQEGALYLIDTLGNYRQISERLYLYPVSQGHFSADGQWIYYAHVSFDNAQTRYIFRIRPDGTGRELLFSSTRFDGAWNAPVPSPDGRYLFVDGYDENSRKPLSGRVDVLSNSVRRYDVAAGKPAYSAAANLVAMEGSDGRIYVARPDGSELRPLTCSVGSFGTGGLSSPSWSPDGNWIVARSEALKRLVVIRASDGAYVPVGLGANVLTPAWKP